MAIELRALYPRPLGILRILIGIKRLSKFLKRTGLNCGPNLLHVALVIPKVVDGTQLRTKHFVALIKMMQISATKLGAGIAVTRWIKRRIAMLVPGVT